MAKHKFSFTISSLRDGAITRRNACCSITLKNSTKTTDIPMGGSAVKNTRLTKEGKTIICKTDNFVPLVVPGLSTSSGINSSSTSTVQDLSPTFSTGADHPPKPKTKIKRGMAIEIRTIVCEIFLNGWSSSQTISRIQKCMHPHTFLRTQDSDSERPTKCGIKLKETYYLYSLPERPKLRSLLAKQNYKGSLQETHWRSSTSGGKVW